MGRYKAAEEMVLDLRCVICLESTLGRGCRCSKNRTYDTAVVDVDMWLASIPADHPTRKTAVSAAGAALTRQRHRAGLRDIPHPDFACSVDEDERAGFIQQHAIEPKWSPPQSRWTPRADSEPI